MMIDIYNLRARMREKIHDPKYESCNGLTLSERELMIYNLGREDVLDLLQDLSGVKFDRIL